MGIRICLFLDWDEWDLVTYTLGITDTKMGMGKPAKYILTIIKTVVSCTLRVKLITLRTAIPTNFSDRELVCLKKSPDRLMAQ
jgi:hypothetical protein